MPRRGPEYSKGSKYDQSHNNDASNSPMPREKVRRGRDVEDVAQRIDQFSFRDASPHGAVDTRSIHSSDFEYIDEEPAGGNQHPSAEDSWLTYNDVKGEGVKYTHKGEDGSTRDISLFGENGTTASYTDGGYKGKVSLTDDGNAKFMLESEHTRVNYDLDKGLQGFADGLAEGRFSKAFKGLVKGLEVEPRAKVKLDKKRGTVASFNDRPGEGAAISGKFSDADYRASALGKGGKSTLGFEHEGYGGKATFSRDDGMEVQGQAPYARLTYKDSGKSGRGEVEVEPRFDSRWFREQPRDEPHQSRGSFDARRSLGFDLPRRGHDSEEELYDD